MSSATFAETIGARRSRERERVVSRDVQVGGAILLVQGAGFIVGTTLAASIARGYDFNAAAISDLGTLPETALVFNTLLLLIGGLNLAAGYLLFRAHGRRRIMAAVALGSVGCIGAGLVPLDRGDLHSVFAVLAFLFVNLQAIGLARLLGGPVRWIGVGAGLVGLAYLGLMVVGDAGNPAVFGAIGHGGSERMIAYPVMLWFIALGGYLLARAQLTPEGLNRRPVADGPAFSGQRSLPSTARRRDHSGS